MALGQPGQFCAVESSRILDRYRVRWFHHQERKPRRGAVLVILPAEAALTAEMRGLRCPRIATCGTVSISFVERQVGRVHPRTGGRVHDDHAGYALTVWETEDRIPALHTLSQYIVDKQASPRCGSSPGNRARRKISFPFPPDWKNAGTALPRLAFTAPPSTTRPRNPENPPHIVAIAS